MIIRTHAYARAGLVGNPSDGFFGKTISIIVKNFKAEATLYETPRLNIVPDKQDELHYASLAHLTEDVEQFGYYGGVRLVKAAIKRFHGYCQKNSIDLDQRNFTIEYKTNIPQRVGLAGSSAIITAVTRALMAFYGVEIAPTRLANFVLSVETAELGLPAGLQDRVIQAFEGCVYMDFDRELMENRGYGEYDPIDPKLLPPLYVAWLSELAEGTEVFHNNIRARWEQNDPEIIEAMKGFAQCAEDVRDLILGGHGDEIGPVLDRNFDLRSSIYKIDDQNLDLVNRAREAGGSAKFAGSGGAIVGAYADDATFERIKQSLSEIGAVAIRPEIE